MKIQNEKLGLTFALTFINQLSGFGIAMSLREKTADSMMGTFLKSVVSSFDLPKPISSDHGSEMKNKTFQKVALVLGCRYACSIPYYTQNVLDRKHS